MVLPLIPIALAGIGGGVAGGAIASIFGGGGKKAQTVSEQHAPYETYQPSTATTTSTSKIYSPSQIIQIESPGATITKKDELVAESAAKGEASPMMYQPSTAPSAGITEGTDLTKIAMIGGAALIGYGIITEVL